MIDLPPLLLPYVAMVRQYQDHRGLPASGLPVEMDRTNDDLPTLSQKFPRFVNLSGG